MELRARGTTLLRRGNHWKRKASLASSSAQVAGKGIAELHSRLINAGLLE